MPIRGHRVTDLHIHIQPWDQLTPAARRTMADPRHEEAEDIARYQQDPAAFLAAMDRWGIERAALINYVAPETLGFDRSVNEWVARYAAHDPRRLIAVGSVNPRIEPDADAVHDAVKACRRSGIRMLKLHPAHQLVWPDAYRADSRGARGHPPCDKPYGDRVAALYEACVRHDLPLMVHTGTSIFPGALNGPADPLLLDAVATDHPDLTLVLAHVGRPLWRDEALFVARRHPNAWLDLSSIPPQRLAHHVPGLAQVADRCLWGTDWPGPGVPRDAPRANVEAFLDADLGLDEAACRMILHENAERLLPTPEA